MFLFLKRQTDTLCERGRCTMGDASSSSSPPDRATLEELKQKLCSGHVDQERHGARELRKLAKVSSVNRFCIADTGAIPLLIKVLSSHDTETQTHAVTALLNLTLRNESNKQAIVLSKGLDPTVEVLMKGSLEARENAAALLFNLSRSDAFRGCISSCMDVFNGLVALLKDGSPRGKKDALAAIYNLLQIRHNRAPVVRAGAVDPLLQLVQDPDSGLVDESLTVLSNLASHQEGRFAIDRCSGIRTLIDVIRIGTDSNKEYACASLLVLCQHDFSCSDVARRLGVHDLLVDLSICGTDRARRKASKVLEFLE